MATKILPYLPPEWASNLKFLPSVVYQSLAMKPTPIQPWPMPEVPVGFQVSIKRDDMTGSVLGGNKIRKLEFILAKAVKEGCKHLITCGGVNSNHCRAVAGAGRLLGLKTHLFLRSENHEDPHKNLGEPNFFLDRLFGADVYLMPRKSPYATHLKPAMESLATQLEKETGETTFHIPVGGSTSVGLFGPMELFEELRRQGLEENFDDIVLAVGSGGTAAGLAIASYLTKSRVKVHAFSVCDDKNYFLGHCQEMVDEIGVDVKAEDILNVIDGYKGAGYGIASPELLRFIEKVSSTSGIVLDPVYTGKAAYGLSEELRRRPSQFRGKRLLFIHTGGLFTKSAQQTLEGSCDFKMETWTEESS